MKTIMIILMAIICSSFCIIYFDLNLIPSFFCGLAWGFGAQYLDAITD